MEKNSDSKEKDIITTTNKTTKKMEDTLKLLKQTEFLVEDTNRIADDTLVELEKQRENIKNIDQKVRETDTEIDESSRILRKIKDGIIKQKLTIVGASGILAALTLFVGIKVAK